MSDVTQILHAIRGGKREAADQLIPLVYEELRQLAAQKLSHESPGQTLDATALVHEAYLRLVGSEEERQQFDGRAHFFAAAAEAMRRILVDHARKRHSLKRGGDRQREPLDADQLAAPAPAPRPDDDLVALDVALNHLARRDPVKAELVKLRYFAGLTLAQSAELLHISHNTADRYWAYAKAFLLHEMESGAADDADADSPA